MKSLWFLVYNITSIHDHQQLESSGALCQASGFLLSVGIEAADAAVFLIALHSTVYIFWPNRAGGESGLYPYRRMAYSFYVLWPILMASLAFVKGIPAYVNTGQSCYLPTAPWWYRITLSWVPRYVTLFIILIMYGSSYTYVRVMMRRYSRRSSEIPVGRPDRLVPPTPPLLGHGLLPSPPASSHRSSSRVPSGALIQTEFLRLQPEQPLTLRGSFRQKFDVLHPGIQMKGNWSWTGFEGERSVIPGPVSPLSVSPMGIITPSTGAVGPTWGTSGASTSLQPPEMALCRRQPATDSPPSSIRAPTTLRGLASRHFYRRPMVSNASTALGGTADDFWGSRLALGPLPTTTLGSSSLLPQTGSQVDICTVLRQGPLRSAAADGSARSSSSSSSPMVMALDQATFESGGISRSRDKIRRQLRLLFIYPAVYACVWVFPFASDVSKLRGEGRDNSSKSNNGPFWLLVVSLTSLCAQGLCDTAVFCTRERPWRHARGGFWESLGLDSLREWRFTLRKDSGRTREEMFNDSARARSRRDEERETEHEYRGSPSGRMPPTGGARNWFDFDLHEGNNGGRQAHEDG